ncbi:hypothetical protein B7P43_G03033 [Cryptotermes secundus]|nr:hypothetical protein B7P43_G03033 [Cryptotermes secundus]
MVLLKVLYILVMLFMTAMPDVYWRVDDKTEHEENLDHETYTFVPGLPGETSHVVTGKHEDGHYVVLDPDGIRRYEYDEWHMKQTALNAEGLEQEEIEVVEYAGVGRQNEEVELKEKRKVGEDELRENRWTGYETMVELKRMEEEGHEKKDQMGAEYADGRRGIREAMTDIENEYENGEEKREFVTVVEVREEEMTYEEEYTREEYVEDKLDVEEDRTKYRPNDDHSHSNTELQDHAEAVFECEISVHLRFEYSENSDVETREEGNKREDERYAEVRDKAGEEKVKAMWGSREIGLQGKTEMVHVDIKEMRIQESVQEMEKIDERREMGEAKKDGEIEKFKYEEREGKGESILEASEFGLEETRYVEIETGEMHLKEKELITETTMELMLSGGHVPDAMDTHLVGQYMALYSARNDQLGSSTDEGVKYLGQAVKPSNQNDGKVEEVNTDVGEPDAEETREVGRKINVNQKEEDKMKEKLFPIDIETQKATGMGHMEAKKSERMQGMEKTGKDKERSLREVGTERKPFEVQEKCVDTTVENDVGENMEIAQANTTNTEEKSGDKKPKIKSKLPVEGKKHRLEGDHAQDSKKRPEGNYNIKVKLDGTIRIYRYIGSS